MTKTREIYRCTICGNVVEVVNPGAVLSCCGQPMMLMKENTTDGAKEKHVPDVYKRQIMGNGSIAKRYIATAPIAALTVSSKSEIILEYILFSR